MEIKGDEFKYIILVRHGEPNNPKKIVYNLDEVMKKEDIIHITEYGKRQLKALGKVIKKKHFKVVRIRHSNQIRAVESALALNKILKVKDIESEVRLRDVYAPGAYIEKLTMDEWKKSGNAYSLRWKKYNHETPQACYNRLNAIYGETAKNIKSGETGILLSHGDTIAWFVNFQASGKFPDPKILRNKIYPVQGQGIVMKLDLNNRLVDHFYLKDKELLVGRSY